MWKNITGKQHK